MISNAAFQEERRGNWHAESPVLLADRTIAYTYKQSAVDLLKIFRLLDPVLLEVEIYDFSYRLIIA